MALASRVCTTGDPLGGGADPGDELAAAVEADVVVPILLYHKIGRPPRGARIPGQYVSSGLFRRHLDYLLAKGYATVLLRDLVYLDERAAGEQSRPDLDTRPGKLPARPVVVTFDDGYRSIYEHAFPALSERGMNATVFLVMGALGGSSLWEQMAGEAAEPTLSPQEVDEMRARGIEFGSHTLSHAHLTSLPEGDAQWEIVESRLRFERLFGEPCLSFAYPYGEWDLAVRNLVEKAGYRIACTTERAAARPGNDLLALPRINVRRYNLLPRFAQKLRRAERARP